MQPARKRIGRIARWFVLVPALLAPPVAAWQTGYTGEFLLAAAAYYAMFAVVLDSWLILSTIGGIFFGLWLDPMVKSGPAEAKIWETVVCLAVGTLLGMVLGFIFDKLSSHRRSADAPRVHSPDAPPADARRQPA
jgi:hypothetical protein